MKTEIKPTKTASEKLSAVRSGRNRPKSNLKAAFGKYKGVIVEKDDCWDKDLKKTITD